MTLMYWPTIFSNRCSFIDDKCDLWASIQKDPKQAQWKTFDVTFVFMLFRIIYAGRAALTFGNDKTSRQYCLEICKEIAVLLIPKMHL